MSYSYFPETTSGKFEFLPPKICAAHAVVGFDPECPDCESHCGVYQLQPCTRNWHFKDAVDGVSTTVSRTQMPIMPEKACALYGLQGTTTDPGLIAHWDMPKRAADDIKFLIVYVMLSRVRGLDCLASVGLDDRIIKIIEKGPPQTLVESFERLFAQKVPQTKRAAHDARVALGWPAVAT